MFKSKVVPYTEKLKKLYPTYIKIVAAGSDPAQGNIVILHAATISCCKGDCTPTNGFASQRKKQLVVAVYPSQHKLVTETNGRGCMTKR